MTSPSSPVLQELHRLDTSSADFPEEICKILYGEEYVRCVPCLGYDDLVWFVDYLDKVLNSLEPSGPASRKVLRELRNTCGTKGILPTTYVLPSQSLHISPGPFASGGCGEVFKGTLDGSTVCIKRARVYAKDPPEKALNAFCKEAVIWKRLKHPNVISLLGVKTTPELQLISDWMPGGDLLEYIKKNSDVDRLGLLSNVTKGLKYLHSCNVIHGDLKGANILVDSSGNARITDFGLAMVTRNLNSIPSASNQYGLTLRWAAPEVMEKAAYSKNADMFSFAMVMIEIFTGAVPFQHISSVAAMVSIIKGTRPMRPEHPAFTRNLWTLMQRCWGDDPGSRPDVSEALQIIASEIPVWKQLITHSLTTNECISITASIFSDLNQAKTVELVPGDYAQNLIDTVDKALGSLTPETRGRCLAALCRICGHQGLLPQSLAISLCYDPGADPLCHGEFTDVWMGQHRGVEVAAKVLRVYEKDNLKKIRKRFCKEVMMWRALRHPNVLPLLGVTMIENLFVMVSEWMGNGCINEFVEKHPDVDRLELLRGAVRGLAYMHDQGIIHGNLRGANILIDNNGNSCLAGFGLLTIVSDDSTAEFPSVGTTSIQWMSPELIVPDEFGLTERRPTKASDCYSFGMVIYEVLSGQIPFSQYYFLAIVGKILEGERPERPQGVGGVWFADSVWWALELCWKPQPSDRINAQTILLGLEGNVSRFNLPPDLSGYDGTDVGAQSNVRSGI